MSFWSSETVRARVAAENLIAPFDPTRVMRGAYELSAGGEAYITSSSAENTTLGPNQRIEIPAGQFGLLVTKEIVKVPNDAMAFLSIKATTKLQGLVNVSGFHVDPGYANTLKFAVYNAGPQPIYIDQNQAVFLIWYASLDRVTEDLYVPRPGTSSSITGEDVKRIAGNVASPAELKAQLDQLTYAYDKRIHELEADSEKRLHGIESRMTIVQGLLIALMLLIVSTAAGIIGTWLKPNSSSTPTPPASSAPPPVPLPSPPSSSSPAALPQTDSLPSTPDSNGPTETKDTGEPARDTSTVPNDEASQEKESNSSSDKTTEDSKPTTPSREVQESGTVNSKNRTTQE